MNEPQAAQVKPEGLDPQAWAAIEAMVLAGSHPSPDAFLAACRRCSEGLALAQQRAVGVYVGYLLRAAVTLSQREDLHGLAESVHGQVGLHLRITTNDIWRTLQTAHDTAPSAEEVAGGDFVVFGTAILGALTRRYDIDLDRLQASLVRWHRSQKAEIEALIAER